MQYCVHNLRFIHVDTLALVVFFFVFRVKFYHLATKKKEGSLKPTNDFFITKMAQSHCVLRKKKEIWTNKYA
jgi:hypothetical protein